MTAQRTSPILRDVDPALSPIARNRTPPTRRRSPASWRLYGRDIGSQRPQGLPGLNGRHGVSHDENVINEFIPVVDVDVPLASGDAQTAHVIGNPQARVCVVLATFEVGVERLRHDAHGGVGRVHDDIHGQNM